VKLRPVQFVCLVLLLSSLPAAHALATPGPRQLEHRYISLVLGHEAIGSWDSVKLNALVRHLHGSTHSSAAVSVRIVYSRDPAVTRTDLAITRAALTMRPPAAQCVALQSVTGFGETASPALA